MSIDADAFRLPRVFKLALYGGSGSGKSHLISELLANLPKCLSSKEPWGRIGIMYIFRSRLPDNLNVEVHAAQNLPTSADIDAFKKKYNFDTVILILDDFMETFKQFKQGDTQTLDLTNFIVDGSRSSHVCMIVTFQVAYPQSDLARLYVRNCTGQIFFDASNDLRSIKSKIASICANPYYSERYIEAVSARQSGYFYVDTNPRSLCPREYRIRNFIVPLYASEQDQPDPSVTSLALPDQQHIYLPPNYKS